MSLQNNSSGYLNFVNGHPSQIKLIFAYGYKHKVIMCPTHTNKQRSHMAIFADVFCSRHRGQVSRLRRHFIDKHLQLQQPIKSLLLLNISHKQSLANLHEQTVASCLGIQSAFVLVQFRTKSFLRCFKGIVVLE